MLDMVYAGWLAMLYRRYGGCGWYVAGRGGHICHQLFSPLSFSSFSVFFVSLFTDSWGAGALLSPAASFYMVEASNARARELSLGACWRLSFIAFG